MKYGVRHRLFSTHKHNEMKSYRYLTLVAVVLMAFFSGQTQAKSNPSRVVYSPSNLEDTYRVDARDISRTAPYADHILVMDELPYTPFNVLEAVQGRVPGVRVFNRGWNYYAVMRGWQYPLYVIDGIPVDASAVNMMSPHDVATVEVHRGFGANLFGTRGSGGAIVINTK